MKKCTKCGEEKELDEFHPRKDRKSGYQSWCKSCKNNLGREAYRKDPEARREAARQWVKDNPEKNCEKVKRYYRQNPDIFRERARKYREQNSEKVKTRNRKYRAANLEKVKEGVRKAGAVWRKKNPAKCKKYKADRKARLVLAEGTFTAEELQALWEMQKGKCVICGEFVGDDYHADHILPLCRGGSNYIENIQILCPPCNLSKHTKTMDEYMEVLAGRKSG